MFAWEGHGCRRRTRSSRSTAPRVDRLTVLEEQLVGRSCEAQLGGQRSPGHGAQQPSRSIGARPSAITSLDAAGMPMRRCLRPFLPGS